MATGFAIAVKLIDLATGPLAKINQALFGVSSVAQKASKTSITTGQAASGAVNKAAQTASSSINKAAKKDVPLLRDSLRELTRNTKEIGESFLKAFTPIETLAIGTSIGGIIGGLGYLTQNFASVGSATLRMSQSLGLNIVDLQNWRGAADLAGIGAEAMTASLQGVSHGIYMARNGLNPELFRAAQQFGIDLNKGATDAERAQNLILQVSDKIRNDPLLKGNVQAQHTLLSALGIDDKMLPLLQRGRVAIEQYIAEARENGYLNQRQAQEADALRQAYTGLEQSIGSTGWAIGAFMGQWLTPMLNEWRVWLNHIRSTPDGLLSVKNAFEQLGNINWTKVGIDLEHMLFGGDQKWVNTGSHLMDLFLQGFEHGQEDLGKIAQKFNDTFGKISSGFADSLEKNIIGAFEDTKFGKDVTRVFQEQGKVTGSVFANDLIKSLVDTLYSDPNVKGITDFFHNIFSDTSWMPDWLNWLTGGKARGGVGGTPGYGAKPAGPLDPKREAEAMQFFTPKVGLARAAGIVAGLEQESRLDPTARNASGHVGIAQWEPSRAAALGGSTDFHTQLQHIWDEYHGAEAPAFARIMAAHTPEDTSVAERSFERGGDYGGRDLTRARQIYNLYKGADFGAAATPAVGAVGAPTPSKPAAVAVPAIAMPKAPVGAPNVTASPAGEMLTLPDVTVTAPAPRATAPIPPREPRAVPIPPLVPGGAAGKQGSLGLDSSHTVQVHFANAPAGMRSGLTQAEGPATVAVRTQYAMDNLS